MSSKTTSRRHAKTPAERPFSGLDEPLAAQLPTFEMFFKTIGFKRVHGRIWGLLVLSGTPLSSREIYENLGLSQGATSMALSELGEWGAIHSEFDASRRCNLHAPVSNTLSIVATVLRRREQVAFQQFKVAATRTLQYVSERYGEKDPRVLTLRSIISTCEIAESIMNLVVGAVVNALDDSESLLYKALNTALKVGVVMPSKLLGTRDGGDAVRRAGMATAEAPADASGNDGVEEWAAGPATSPASPEEVEESADMRPPEEGESAEGERHG